MPHVWDYDYLIYCTPSQDGHSLDRLEAVTDLTIEQIQAAVAGNDWIEVVDKLGKTCAVKTAHIWRVADAGYGLNEL